MDARESGDCLTVVGDLASDADVRRTWLGPPLLPPEGMGAGNVPDVTR